VLKVVLPKDAIKADGYLSRLQQFLLDAVAPPAALLESTEAGELTPEKDCPVFDGECASTNGTGAEEEADFKAKSFIEVHGEKFCLLSANVVWGGVCQTSHHHSGSGESHEGVKL